MSHSDSIDIDEKSPPFDRLRNIQRLAKDRSGRSSGGHVRHHLYVARDMDTRAHVLVKLTSKPGLVYEQNLTNEIASLTTINRELPDSRYFPVLRDHGRIRDGRVYLIASLFDELPLAASIATERMPARMVGYLRTAIEIAHALVEIHRLDIFHVDVNPMNVLFRTEQGRPIIRIVDFESSYERPRHSAGAFYSPPTTPGYTAPEVTSRAPDARADVFSLGAVLYTMLAGHQWTWEGEVGRSVEANGELDPELRHVLLAAVDPNPDRRYPSITAFRDGLGAYLETIWPGRSW